MSHQIRKAHEVLTESGAKKRWKKRNLFREWVIERENDKMKEKEMDSLSREISERQDGWLVGWLVVFYGISTLESSIPASSVLRV